MMNYLQEIYNLYESRGGISYNPPVNQDYSAQDSKYSYSARAIQGTKGADNFYTANAPTSVPVGEQEEDIALSSKEIISKINQLIAEAERDGMDYCIHTLTTLRDFIRRK